MQYVVDIPLRVAIAGTKEAVQEFNDEHRKAGEVARNRPGVGLRGGLRLRRRAGLDGKDRLAHGNGAAGRVHERFRPANAFDEQHDLTRLGIVDDEVEVVGEAEIGLVA